MTVPFKQLPLNIRVPLFYAEVDNSQANSAVAQQRALIIGQITSAGIGAANVPVISQGVGDAQVVGGPTSMLAEMLAAYRLNDSFGEVWYLPIADDPGAVASTGTVTFTAPPTASGVLSFYLGGRKYSLPVTAAQTAVQVATALAALVNANGTSPVVAAAAAGVVTFTATNKGPVGNNYDIRVNYVGSFGGEATPAGLAFTIVPMSGGATAPSLTAALANLGSQTFDFIVCPYTDAATLDALKAFLNDTAGRWSWAQQLYGHVFACAAGTLGALTTLGLARNNQHETILGVNNSPTPAHVIAAQYTAAAAISLRNDPGLPLQTLVVQGLLAPPLASRFALTDQNTLLYDGISTFSVAADGTCSIQNLITTYQKNAFGNADNSYLQIETLFTLAFVLRDLAGVVTSKFARVKLAADGTRFAAGSAIVTPGTIRAELINRYTDLEYRGYVQNSAAFKASLVVEKDAANPNRVNVLWPAVLINQLRIFAVLAQFRLQ